MKPSGAGAVMADRAWGEVEADTPEQALHRKLGFFPTPPWAARAGGELIRRLDPRGCGRVWEPACGQGHMAHGLSEYFDQVDASDIHAHGWTGQFGEPFDFLSPAADIFALERRPDWIVTNPPFHLAAEFVECGLRRATRGVAVLCRLAFGETPGRFGLLYGGAPIGVKAPFMERVPMHLGRWLIGGDTATAYAWFIWFQPHVEPHWIAVARAGARIAGIPDFAADLPIRPGTRERLTRPDDARLFGWKAPAPLFGEVSDA